LIKKSKFSEYINSFSCEFEKLSEETLDLIDELIENNVNGAL